MSPFIDSGSGAVLVADPVRFFCPACGARSRVAGDVVCPACGSSAAGVDLAAWRERLKSEVEQAHTAAREALDRARAAQLSADFQAAAQFFLAASEQSRAAHGHMLAFMRVAHL